MWARVEQHANVNIDINSPTLSLSSTAPPIPPQPHAEAIMSSVTRLQAV